MQVPKCRNGRNMGKKSKLPFSDTDLFRQEMADVLPLKQRHTTESRKPRKPARRSKPDLIQENLSRSDISALSGQVQDHAGIEAEDSPTHRKNGVQIKMVQKLKRGRFPVSRQLDLHHMTTETAQRVLLEFIAETQGETLECVRVIHGKGLRSENGPRLKLMTRRVLRDHHRVLAFTPCKQAHGGTGAMDVLLKST